MTDKLDALVERLEATAETCLDGVPDATIQAFMSQASQLLTTQAAEIERLRGENRRLISCEYMESAAMALAKMEARAEAAQKEVTDLALRNAELALELLAAEKHAEMLTAALEMSGVDADEILDAMEEVSHDRL